MEADQTVDTPNGGVHQGHHGPPQTDDDPTAGGYYCGSRRQPNQITDESPHPYCRNRAGQGTDHVGIGQCKFHLGTTRNQRTHARRIIAQQVDTALRISALAMHEAERACYLWLDNHPDQALPDKLFRRLIDARHYHQSILDRGGYPRRTDVHMEDARESLLAKLESYQQSDEAEN